MTLIVLLLVLGLLLLGVEIFAPGGILGAIGAVAMIAGCIVAYNIFGIKGCAITTAVTLVALSVAIYVEMVILPKTALGRSLFVNDPSDHEQMSADKENSVLIGQDAVTETMLAPTGYVLIGSKRHEAMSQSGLIAQNISVKVIGSNGSRLVVSSK